MGDAPSGIGGQSSWTIRKSAGIGSRKWYGGLPSSSSMTVHPTLLRRRNEVAMSIQGLRKSHQAPGSKTNGDRTDQISDAVVAPDCSITSGATAQRVNRADARITLRRLTPIRTPNNRIIPHTCRRTTGNPKICQLNLSILICKDICTFDISVYDTLVVKVRKPLENLRDVYGHKCFGELAKLLANVV